MPTIRLDGLVASYVDGLWNKRRIEGSSAEKYSLTVIVPRDWNQWDVLQNAVKEAIAQKWGNNPPAQLKLPWLNKYLQPAVLEDGPYAGCYYMHTYSEEAPQFVDENNQFATAQGNIFSGAKCNVYLGVYGYQQGGVALGLNAVQVADRSANMPRLSERKAATEVFAPIPGAPPVSTPPPAYAPPPVASMPAPAPVPPGAPAPAPYPAPQAPAPAPGPAVAPGPAAAPPGPNMFS